MPEESPDPAFPRRAPDSWLPLESSFIWRSSKSARHASNAAEAPSGFRAASSRARPEGQLASRNVLLVCRPLLQDCQERGAVDGPPPTAPHFAANLDILVLASQGRIGGQIAGKLFQGGFGLATIIGRQLLEQFDERLNALCVSEAQSTRARREANLRAAVGQ